MASLNMFKGSKEWSDPGRLASTKNKTCKINIKAKQNAINYKNTLIHITSFLDFFG